MNEGWLSSSWFAWVVLPFLIFIARIADVTIGTIRLIFVARGMKVLAPLAGFFEVLIWLVVIGQIMQHLANPLCYVAYAAGFASGNFIGMMLVERLALGSVIIRIITQKDASGLVESLKQHRFGVTVLEGRGVQGNVQVIFMVVKRAHLEEVQRLIHQFHPQAFYTIEEVGDVEKGVFPIEKNRWKAEWLRAMMPFRKGK